MKNNFVNNETNLLCYRLRTARQRKRAAYKDYEKKLRALDREEDELYQKRLNLGWLELKPPLRRGWERHFVLRDDVARSKQASFFQRILDKINTVEFSWRKDFKVTRKRHRREGLTDRLQLLMRPDVHQMKGLRFTEKEMHFFDERITWDRHGCELNKKYVFTEPWRFVLKVRPRFITKVRRNDAELESMMAHIRKIILSRHLEPKIYKLKGGGYRDIHDWQRHAETKDDKKFRNTPLVKILDQVNDGET